jgi:(p)ppGpp synthase/HD superfamily hydrolase
MIDQKGEQGSIEDAVALAALAHRGQRDKAGQPYVFHVLRVMLRQEGNLAQIAGVLHDVVEDTPTSLDDLRTRGFPTAAINAVELLTRQSGQDYDSYLAGVLANSVARGVKLADLEDNLDLRRLVQSGRGAKLAERDVQRLEGYLAAWLKIKQVSVVTP